MPIGKPVTFNTIHPFPFPLKEEALSGEKKNENRATWSQSEKYLKQLCAKKLEKSSIVPSENWNIKKAYSIINEYIKGNDNDKKKDEVYNIIMLFFYIIPRHIIKCSVLPNGF